MATLGEDLLGIVNKLQDLVFNTIGNDSLDLPQIVRQQGRIALELFTDQRIGCRWFSILRKVLCIGEHSWTRLSASRKWHCYPTSSYPSAHQHPARRQRPARRCLHTTYAFKRREPRRMGRVPSHSWSQVHKLSRCQARNRE